MAKQTLNDGESGFITRGKINDNFDELYLRLIEWTQGKDYEPLVVTRDSEDRVTSMTVKWPDGSAGIFTSTDYNATEECYDGYNITHADSSKTVTQAAVTRNANGAIINKPALTVA